MPRRNLTPPPSPSPQTPPTPAVPAPGMPSHLQRPKALDWNQFPQHKAFLSGLPIEHPAHAQVQDLLMRSETDPTAAQTLQDREAQSNFNPYQPAAPAAPAAPAGPGAMDYVRDVVDATNSGIGNAAHNIVGAGVHGLGYLAGQGEGLVNAVTGSESGIAGELVRGFDEWNTGTQAADGSVFQPKTVPGMIAQPLAQGLTGVVAGGPVVNATRVASAPWLAQGIARGGLADALAFDPMAPRGSDLYNDFVTPLGGAPTAVTGALAQQPGDGELMGRLKNVAEGGIIGTALEGGMRGIGGLFRGAPAPVPPHNVPLPPEAMARGEFAPVVGGPEIGPPQMPPGASPFQRTFGDGPGQSPFGNQFQVDPAAPRAPLDSTVAADPVIWPDGPGELLLPNIARGDFVPTGARQTLGPDGLPVGTRGDFVPTGTVRQTDASGLPAGRPGEFVPTGDAPAVGPDGLPLGQRGDFVPTGGAALDADGFPIVKPGDFAPVMPDGAPHANWLDNGVQQFRGEGRAPIVEANPEAPGDLGDGFFRAQTKVPEGFSKFDADPRTAEGFNRFDPAPAKFDGYNRIDQAPPTQEGYFKPAPKRPNVQPQMRDSGFGQEAPVTGPFPGTGGIDPNAVTRVGPTALDPVEDTVNYTRPSIAPGERMARARSETTPGDPYAETFRQSKLDPDAQPEAADPLASLEPEEWQKWARKEGTETEVQLDPVQVRANQATDVIEPVRPNVTPARSENTTLRDVPVVSPKPGLSHLSPDAQEWVSKLKPGEREALSSSIAHFRRNPDPEGDLGNLQQVLAFKKPGSRAKEGPQGPKAGPLGSAEGMTPRSPRIEADLVQAGFRQRGDVAPQKPVDTQAPTERIEKPKPLFDADRPKTAGLDPKDLKPLLDAVVGISQFAGRAVKGGIDLWSKRLYKVVGDMPGGKAAAEKAKTVIDRTRQLQGQFDADRQRFLKEMRGRSPRAKAARASFAEVDWDGEAGFARINDVLDGEAKPRPHEAPAVKAYRQAFQGTGRAAEDAAFEIRIGDKMVRFKTDANRQRAPRIGTRDLHWYASHPAHPETQRLAEIISEYNPGMTKDAVLKELDFWTEKGITKRGLAEDARTIEHFPTHYRNSKGQVVQLLESDPQRIIDAVTRRFPARIAYKESFGQDGVPKELADIQAHGGETGQKAAHNLMRALNGMDLDKVAGWTDPAEPGSNAAWASRALEIPWTAWKMLKLSMAPLANVPETIGKGRSITGGNLVSGALGVDGARMAKAGFDVSFLNKNSKELVDDLANRGLLTRDLMDWYYNKSDVPETLNRYVLNTGGAVNQFVNEFNEKMVAHLADGWSGQLKNGQGGVIDRFRLKVLEFRPDQIDAIMSGKASKQVYNDVAARAVEWAQGSTSQAAERSRAGGSRIWNRATIADRFAQMNINRNFDAWAKAGKALADSSSSWKDRLAGVAFAADLTVGQTAAAAMTLAAKAMVAGGGAVLLDKVTGSPLGLADFLLDAAKYALLGGPVQSVVEATTSDDESVAEALTGGLLPISTLQNLKNMFTGAAKYEGMTPLERAGEFLRSGTPAAPAVANIVAMVGIAEDDPELDASISAFHKWRAKYAATGHIEGQEADTTGFRAAMRKAVNAMRDGKDPSEAINAALAAKGGKTVRQSLQGKRLLKNLKPEQLAELREYLGERTMTKLEQYDALLDAWAAVAYRPKR